jgi:hypothetical protein
MAYENALRGLNPSSAGENGVQRRMSPKAQIRTPAQSRKSGESLTCLHGEPWLPVFRMLGAELWPGGRLLASRAGSLMDANGESIDSATRDNVGKFVKGFVAYMCARKNRASA